jgi:YgiT-type zinc finger domain-containing protein
MKCLCGNNLKECLKDETIRHYDSLIKVKNVPVEMCVECEEGFHSGRVFLKLSKLATKAYDQGMNEIDFDTV